MTDKDEQAYIDYLRAEGLDVYFNPEWRTYADITWQQRSMKDHDTGLYVGAVPVGVGLERSWKLRSSAVLNFKWLHPLECVFLYYYLNRVADELPLFSRPIIKMSDWHE